MQLFQQSCFTVKLFSLNEVSPLRCPKLETPVGVKFMVRIFGSHKLLSHFALILSPLYLFSYNQKQTSNSQLGYILTQEQEYFCQLIPTCLYHDLLTIKLTGSEEPKVVK